MKPSAKLGQTYWVVGLVGVGMIADAATFTLLLLVGRRLDVNWGLTVILLARLAPPILLAPALGWLVDRQSTRWTWTVALGLAALATGSLGWVNSLSGLVAIVAALALVDVVIGAAVFASLPRLPGMSDHKASSLAVLLTAATGVVGPPFAAALALTFGRNAAFAVDAGMLALCSVGLGIVAPRVRRLTVETTNWREIFSGGRVIYGSSRIRRLIPVVLVLALATSSEDVAGTFYLQDVAGGRQCSALCCRLGRLGLWLERCCFGARSEPVQVTRQCWLDRP